MPDVGEESDFEPRRRSPVRGPLMLLLDTNILSELRKGARPTSACDRVCALDDADLFLSVLVAGELRQGVERVRLRDAALPSISTAGSEGSSTSPIARSPSTIASQPGDV